MAAKTLTGAQFRAEMKRPKAGAYLLWGEEGYQKRRALDELRVKICADETLSSFNHFVFTSENYTSDALTSAVLAPAMMTDLKLVELYCLPFADYRKREDQDSITSAIESAAKSEDTLLVIYTTPENFDPGELPRSPSAWMKLLSKSAVAVEFAHEQTPKLVPWAQKHFTSVGIVAEPEECTHLIETVGHDMATLENEMEKLCCFLKFDGRNRLSRSDIDNVCPHNKEIGAFDFADAILDSDSEKAYYILADLQKKSESPQAILGSITKIYLDLLALKLSADAGITSDEAAKKLGIHPYVAKLRMNRARNCDRRAIEAIIDLCAATDTAMKSSGADEFVLLERLIAQSSQLRKKRTKWN